GIQLTRGVPRMKADEEVCLIVVCNGRPGLVIESNVGIPRQKDGSAQAHLKRRSQSSSKDQRKILLRDCGAFCSGRNTAVAGLDGPVARERDQEGNGRSRGQPFGYRASNPNSTGYRSVSSAG